MLYIVSTPIGNLEDISQRALRILKDIPLLITESPQDTGKLLHGLEIGKKKMVKYNDKNKKRVTDSIISLIKEEDAVYVSSAGTPSISDPGSDLVRRAQEEGIGIQIIPGPSALSSIVAASGLWAKTIVFVGFLPKKKKQIHDICKKYNEKGTLLVFFESPYRIIKTLGIIDEVLPQAQLCVGKEITKVFEEYVRGTPKEVIDYFSKHMGKVKGEFSIALSPPKK